MNWFKRKVVDIDAKEYPKESVKESSKLERAVADLKTQLDNAQATIKEIEQRTFNSMVVIDWSTMRAFSVERTMSGLQPVTVIGYVIVTVADEHHGNEVVKEWTLHCSDEQHEKLAMEFKAHLKASK